jgi:phospholipase A1
LNTGVAAAQKPCWNIGDATKRLDCYDQQDKKLRSRSASPDEIDWALTTTKSVEDQYSLLNDRWELESDLGEFIFRAYKPVYFLPVFYTSDPNYLPRTDNPLTTLNEPLDLDHTEAKFQLSFKTKLADNLIADNGDLWLGYTQTSRWQIYNGKNSRAFRETNHEPEFMFVWRTDYSLGNYRGRLLSLSLNHQSNGQTEPESRSWNRLILTVGFDRPDWVLLLRPWYRIPEVSSDKDENPKILDYIGRGELIIVHRRKDSHQIAAQIRHSLKDGEDSHGSFRLNWSYPCFDRLRCHAEIFTGYGESLIDFNHRNTAVGLGVALLEWF